MRHRFQTQQWVGYGPERVFRFFTNPANLPPLMPAWQQARIERARYVAPPGASGVVAGPGSTITISFRPIAWLPLRLEWEAWIAEFRWNDYFCDEQRRGPFHYFRHCHRVRAEAGGSVVSDVVEYELALGVLGDLAHQLVVNKQMQSLFCHRQKMLPQLLALEAGEWA